MRLILTGTPIMNNLMELWTLFDWTLSGQLLGMPFSFNETFSSYITRAREKDATMFEQRLGLALSNGLQTVIQPFILRRTAASVFSNDCNNASNKSRLPVKKDLICWLALSEIQRKVYKDFLTKDKTKAMLSTAKNHLNYLTVMKDLCNHVRILSNKKCKKLGLTMGAEWVDLDKLDDVADKDSTRFTVGHIDDDLLIRESGKLNVLVKLLDHLISEKHRCLLFTESRKFLNIIQKVVDNRGIHFLRLDGSIWDGKKRQKIITTFMTDPSYSLFLLTKQVGAIGLTLTAADRVILMEPSWNPALDKQAISRAYRIGQDKHVYVYRLVTCGSLEEKICRRQVFKENLSRSIIGDEKDPYRYFSCEELTHLFDQGNTSFSATQQKVEKLCHDRLDADLETHVAVLHSFEICGITDRDHMLGAEMAVIEQPLDDETEALIASRVAKALEQLSVESDMNVVDGRFNYTGPELNGLEKIFRPVARAGRTRNEIEETANESSDCTDESTRTSAIL